MKSDLWHTVLLALLVASAGARPALAHAFLDHAEPKVGSEVAASPAQIKIWFTEELEPAFSSIQVLDAQGKQVDKKDFHLDPNDKKLALLSLPDLPAGSYKVVWHVVSTDTHKTQGNFIFAVKPGNAAAQSLPAAPS